MSTINEADATRLPIPPKFKMEEWYMLTLCGLTAAQMKELTKHYLMYLKQIANAEADLYVKYYNVLDNLESKV